ncbi:ATP-binding protein [Methylobacterium terricola]|uniref:ATP-binding protein n=1 Tax=Methylobacterium terricola TaxID=2583531 RepID=A0A5C4LA33_9HYPH|nr:ATP-binding protein [Methylobacterium terricola]TNC09043.1 ATP-binding protein [Methylobacterium terricola]
MDGYEQTMMRHYALAALKAPRSREAARPRRPDRQLAKWLVDNALRLGCEPPDGIDPDVFDMTVGRVDRATWAAMGPLLDQLGGTRPPVSSSPLQKRLDWLCRTLSLGAIDAEILALCVRVTLFRPLNGLGGAIAQNYPGHDEINVTAMAALTGRPAEVLRTRLRPASPLRLLGLVDDRNGGDYAPTKTVMRIARMTTTREDSLRRALLGRAPRATLAWEDFAHLGPVRDLAERLVGAALRDGATGVNILLHGAPGTGKTEFARTLATRLDASASFVGEADEDDGEPTRQERIAAFAVARALAGRAGRIILVMDEADDVFAGVDENDGAKRQGSKVFMNRLVETTEAPTVWITNHPERLGPAVMRRMSLAIRLREPGRAGRRVMLARIAAQRKLRLESADLDRLCALSAAPAILDAGVRAAKLTGGGVSAAELATRSIAEAMGSGPATVGLAAPSFDPGLSRADIDLAHLADRVAACPGRALSFCFHGLPGTGKSAYARHLAARLGIDVVERRASDLLSMWLGATEAAIAAAFEEAADRGAMLILDEADSFLRDRRGARARWEVSQVNEMLARMEAASHPFACTTNLMDSLDPATLRRFLFKVEFRAMDWSQARTAFRRYLGAEPPPALDGLDRLTPGDFALVARKAALLGERQPDGLLALLRAETDAKPGAARAPIGFTR